MPWVINFDIARRTRIKNQLQLNVMLQKNLSSNPFSNQITSKKIEFSCNIYFNPLVTWHNFLNLKKLKNKKFRVKVIAGGAGWTHYHNKKTVQ